MVDQQSGSYRPRRAIIEPELEPTPPSPAGPASLPTPPPAVPPAVAETSTRRVSAPNFDDEDTPKPLYRDEYLPQSLHREDPTAICTPSPTASVNGNGATHGARADLDEIGSDDTQIRSFTFAPRTRRSGEDTSTTILARSGSSAAGRYGPAGPSSPETVDDYDEDEERKPIGDRARLALIIGVVAAVVVLGLAIGYVVLRPDDRGGTVPSPSQSGSIGPQPTAAVSGGTAPTTGGGGTGGGALLTNDLMLSAAQAKRLDSGRTWKETLTQKGASPDAPVPACFGGEPEEGQPVSQQKILRVLSSSGKRAPSALHDATAYATPEEAAQAYRTATKTLGTCAAGGAWLESGRLVRGLGNDATGAVVPVVNGKATETHSVVVSITGRVVNILDASRPGSAIAPATVATALGDVVKKQCGPAGGKCTGEVSTKIAPPPLGGDVPGHLAVGDLPPVAASAAVWNAAPVDLPEEDFVGASCENVDWTTTRAEERSARVYLHPESGTAYFGVNEIQLVMKDAKLATAFAENLRKSLETCKQRLLTATVSKPKKVSSVGAQNATVTGYTATVEQKGTQGSNKFRVGVVATGSKVVYTFANPKGDFDFTDKQWDTIAVRAGERITQIR